MDKERLRVSAEHLDELLIAHAHESEAVDALNASLHTLIQAAKAGQITSPVPSNKIPGGRTFLEGDLASFPAIEDVYSEFCFLVSGREAVMDQEP